jgi:hypothetical protein
MKAGALVHPGPFMLPGLLRTSMRRHCLSSRRGGRSPLAERNCCMPFALCFHPHSLGELAPFGGSVHMMRSVFFGQRRCDLPIGLAGFRVDQVRWRSRLMLDPKRVRAQKPCVWR